MIKLDKIDTGDQLPTSALPVGLYGKEVDLLR